MADREYNVANSYESTLSASLGAGDTTINVSTTDGTPGTPFYVVIDPDDDSKREIIGVDQGKTGTTLTLSSSSQRGLDGTTDVDHDANAVIGIYPIAALWEDINDRVDQHSHGGGTDGAAVDHGGLSGLGDDDHTQYHNDARHDAHDHSTAAASIASADLADHDKATHDALGIDADTVDGIDGATTIQGAIDDINSVISANEDSVAASEDKSTTGFGDLTTAGPSVTITTGTAVLVSVSCRMRNNTAGEVSLMDFEVSGASSRSPTAATAFRYDSSNAGDESGASRMSLVTGLTAGSNTFTAKYNITGGTSTFSDRRLLVVPLGD